MEHVGYPPMSGSNTFCVAKVLIETGMVQVQEPITEFVLESPAGLIPIRADVANGAVGSISFQNVPSFVVHLGAALEVPTMGSVTVDIAYGGDFFVMTDAATMRPRLQESLGRRAG